MPECEWGAEDCKFIGERCDRCFTTLQQYVPLKRKVYKIAKHAQKADKRGGSNFEFRNHKNNQKMLKDDVVSNMTLNSGATAKEKGDEQIRGIIRIMEELKTKTAYKAPGAKTFTIQKKWLNKLNREAKAENMEFWYLKFCFYESDEEIYCITEQDVISSMVNTMIADRRKAKLVEAKIEVANNRRRLAEAENVKLLTEIDLLKSQLKLQKLSEENDDG